MLIDIANRPWRNKMAMLVELLVVSLWCTYVLPVEVTTQFYSVQPENHQFPTSNKNISLRIQTITDRWGVSTRPSSLQKLVWKSDATDLSVNVSSFNPDVFMLTLEAVVDDASIAEIIGPALISISDERADNSNNSNDVTFRVQPLKMGRTRLLLYMTYKQLSNGTMCREIVSTMEISVIKVETLMDKIFPNIIAGTLILVTLSMGAEMDMATVKSVLRKPKAPLIAIFSQFVFMPLLAYGIIWLQGYSGGRAFGFFMLGIAPGGGPSNMYTHLLGGDMSISVTMTFMSCVLSVAFIPFWLYTLGTTLPQDDQEITIPFAVIGQTIAVLVIPLAIGLILQYKLPKIARVLKKALTVMMIFALLLLFATGFYTSRYVFDRVDGEVMLTAALLPYGGFILGAALAFLFRMEWKIIKTISIETGLQNSAIPFMVVQKAFTSPDLELAITPVLWGILATPIPLIIATTCYLIYNRCKSKEAHLCEVSQDVESMPSEGQPETIKLSVENKTVHGEDKSNIITNIHISTEDGLSANEQQRFLL